MPGRSWWYDEPEEPRRFGGAGRGPGRGRRPRRSRSTALVIVGFLIAIAAFNYMNPKTTCGQSLQRRADGVTVLLTECRETRSFLP